MIVGVLRRFKPIHDLINNRIQIAFDSVPFKPISELMPANQDLATNSEARETGILDILTRRGNGNPREPFKAFQVKECWLYVLVFGHGLF
jgi:hypothetical protein